MPKRQIKNKKTSTRYKHYKLEGNKLSRTKKTCPKCGAGYFLAQHKDREYCGHCSYTVFKGKQPVVKEEKPKEEVKTEKPEPKKQEKK